MTPHPSPLLFVPSEGGFARYLGEIRSPMPEQQQCKLTRTRREHSDHDAAHKLVAGVLRFLAIGTRFSRSRRLCHGNAW